MFLEGTLDNCYIRLFLIWYKDHIRHHDHPIHSLDKIARCKVSGYCVLCKTAHFCCTDITAALETFRADKQELACVRVQDRHTIIRELMPDPSEPWASTLTNQVPRGFAAVYDGHKQSKPAEMAAERMQAYLTKCGDASCL